MHITPKSCSDHSDLEADVDEHLRALGFLTTSATYHDVMEPSIVRTLQRTDNPTAFFIRTRSDRIAIHPKGCTFGWECKTNASPKSGNMATEAFPLAWHHRLAVDFGVRCLYIYRDTRRNYEMGFWAHHLPPIEKLFIPTRRWTDLQVDWFAATLGEIFQADPILLSNGRGSGDPFVLIKESIIRRLPSWQSLVDNYLQRIKAA